MVHDFSFVSSGHGCVDDKNLISIVIPTMGRPSLRRTLESIYAAAKGVDFEVIVCSDSRASTIDLPAMPELKLVKSSGPGVNRARNEGARQSRGNVIWFLDDDVELHSTRGLKEHFSIFRNQAIVAAGGEYLSDDSSTWTERAYNLFCSLWRSSAGIENREQLLGGTLAVRRTAFERVGGFDERIEYGGSETLMVCRLNEVARAEEKIIFDSRLNVVHRPGARSLARWIRIAGEQGRRKVETEKALPSFKVRARRSIQVLRSRPIRVLPGLILFAALFVAVSKRAAWARR